MFESLANFFYLILYQPLFNCLVFLYNYLPGHDFGIAVILLTIIIRFAIYPLSVKAAKSQKAMQALQPKMKEVQERHKNDKEKQAKEMFELYKKEKINPFSGLFLAIIQLPILFALYKVFWNGLNPNELTGLYGFISNPGHINAAFLGAVNLAKPNFILAILAGVMQYFQTKMLAPKQVAEDLKNKKPDMAQMMQKQMLYFFPVFTVIILINLPSALGLYWTTSGVFSVMQQYLMFKKSAQTEKIKN